MRVLLIRPGVSFSVQDVAFGWRDGLEELGVEVADWCFDARLEVYSNSLTERDGELRKTFDTESAVRVAAHGLYADCYTFLPDVVLVVSGFFMPNYVLDTIRARGAKVVLLCTESPYEDDRQLKQAEHADLVVLNDPTNLDKFRAVCRESFYVPHAYDSRRHYPGPADPDKACDFAFVGTGFPSRVAFLEAVDLDGLHVILAGSWGALPETSPLRPLVAHPLDWCIDNAEAADLYRSTKSSINLYRREAHDNDTAAGWAMGPREVELAACETFFLRDSRPESDELFPMLPTFTEPDEIRPLLDWWLAHDNEREEAALKARAAIADRTFTANAAWLAQKLGA